MAKLTVRAEPNTQNINMVVTINASLEKVFEAYTDKELVAKWWSQGEEMRVDYYDATEGGKWRFVTPSGDGTGEDGFHGCFHTIDNDKKCVIQTFEYEGLPESGHVALERADFKAVAENQTEIKIVSTYQSVEDRDGMVGAGMEAGFRGSIEALEQLVSVK